MPQAFSQSCLVDRRQRADPCYPCEVQMAPARIPQFSKGPFAVSLLCAGLLAAFQAPAQSVSDQARFHIQKGSKVIGHVLALKSRTGSHTNYVMTSRAEFNLAWKYVVNTHGTTEYRNNELYACGTMVAVNNALRDSSYMARGSDRCFVYPEIPFSCERSTQWTTARMYFEEPLHQDHIFVESALRALVLEPQGEGRYLLRFPNGNTNLYLYRGGLLQEVHVDRPLVNLVFRRN